MVRRVVLVAVITLIAALLAPPVGAQTSGGPLPIPPPEVNEQLPPGLIQYSDVAARLNDIAARSDRVSVEVFGESAGGRDLYLATVADPDASLRRAMQFRQLMISDPAAARALLARFPGIRVPVFVNCSIHGNEYEGTDACIASIERLAEGDDDTTQAVLDQVIVLFNVVQNPDGRVENTRQNTNGFDLNRDFITNSQPETAVVRDLMVQWNPMVTLDLHGYVNPMLIEPTTPPHNPNYEYDLYIRYALAQAEAMEQGVVGAYAALRDDPDFADDYATHIAGALASEDDVIIPFRDWEVGDWDDWPPIFTPMYAMYHGSFGHTLEAPLNPRSAQLSQEARAARARVNDEAHRAAVWSMLDYVVEHKAEMTSDQLEIFERGAAGVGPVPVEPGFVPGFGPEDQYPASYPEAYVIPVGDGQASELAAARLVEFLIAHGIDVDAATRDFAVDGTRWPRGSYVVPMRQARRGLANTMLELGYDITERTPQMYDISGWSHAELWGATVVTVPRGTDVTVRTRRVRDARVVAPPPRNSAAYAFELDSEPAIAAANELLADGVALHLGPADGTVILTGRERRAVTALARRGIAVRALRALPDDAEPIAPPRIAAAIGADDRFVLDGLGFDVDPVTVAALNDGSVKLADHDVLMVSAGFDRDDLSADAADDLDAWLADGGGVVGLGAAGATLNADAGWLDVGFRRGPACAVANGVVAVANDAASPVVAGFPDDDTSFVYDPLWFTDTGDGVRVDQRYDDGDVLLAGHWLGDFEDWIGDTEPGGPNCGDAREDSGQQDAAGFGAIVSGASDDGRVVLFGTQPMFRAHPKKLYQQVAQSLYWVSAQTP
ncbi:MAG TPA: M14 family zinc carboxypeptidase [Euzebyales bacterium]|nr:M14 family zinc carboxypeptidase [Euzebyales bacterium]